MNYPMEYRGIRRSRSRESVAHEMMEDRLSRRAALGAITLLSLGLWATIWLVVSGIARVVFGQ
jgi:hypothetical protein